MAKWNVPSDKPEGEKGPIHPEGTWDATVISARVDKTKNGKDMIRLEFKTSQGKVNGRLIHSPDSSKAAWAFFKQLDALGVDRDYLESKEPEIDDIAAETVKSRVLIRVGHSEYQGDTFADVEWIDKIPESGIVTSPTR